MPDFLGRLAERALEVAEVVQPRLALFAAGAGLAAEELIEISDTANAPRSEPPAAPPMALVGPPSVESSVGGTLESSLEAPRRDRDAQTVELRIVATEEAAAPVPPRRGAATQGIETPPREAVGVRPVRETEPPLLLPERRVVPEPSFASEAALAAARPPASALAEGPSFEGAQPLGRTPDAAPTVHVTIGRVEVRAVFPAPESPRPAPAPPQPSLTLDEYLKQRREGAR